jgi:hypothetical protein
MGVYSVGINTVSVMAVIVAKAAFIGSFRVSAKYCLLIS